MRLSPVSDRAARAAREAQVCPAPTRLAGAPPTALGQRASGRGLGRFLTRTARLRGMHRRKGSRQADLCPEEAPGMGLHGRGAAPAFSLPGLLPSFSCHGRGWGTRASKPFSHCGEVCPRGRSCCLIMAWQSCLGCSWLQPEPVPLTSGSPLCLPCHSISPFHQYSDALQDINQR